MMLWILLCFSTVLLQQRSHQGKDSTFLIQQINKKARVERWEQSIHWWSPVFKTKCPADKWCLNGSAHTNWTKRTKFTHNASIHLCDENRERRSPAVTLLWDSFCRVHFTEKEMGSSTSVLISRDEASWSMFGSGRVDVRPLGIPGFKWIPFPLQLAEIVFRCGWSIETVELMIFRKFVGGLDSLTGRLNIGTALLSSLWFTSQFSVLITVLPLCGTCMNVPCENSGRGSIESDAFANQHLQVWRKEFEREEYVKL